MPCSWMVASALEEISLSDCEWTSMDPDDVEIVVVPGGVGGVLPGCTSSSGLLWWSARPGAAPAAWCCSCLLHVDDPPGGGGPC